MRERIQIRSIPPRTTLDALREQEGRWGRVGLKNAFPGSSVSIGRLSPKEPRQSGLGQRTIGFNVEDHVFRKPAKEEPNKPLIVPEAERII